jgi:hypothetical protein
MRINGYIPRHLTGAVKNEFGGLEARSVDRFVQPGRTLTDLIECRYPGPTGSAYAARVSELREIVSWEKGERGVHEREEGVDHPSLHTLNGEIAKTIELYEEVLEQAHGDTVSILGDRGVTIDGEYDSKSFWSKALRAVEEEVGAPSEGQFSEANFSVEARALLCVGREESDPDVGRLALLSELVRMAEHVTDGL